ncbi:UvrD-helicase domain-containing protein [Mobilicoccus caccae]|uniref:UvrD-helicase domain-containing protein n=1 Tax=Mobilicoccus caccae TaxID=1859295 RepID=UPI0024E18289|nr:UvrD-helicase domain-containing protein [Mobilicoccus caccae]
MTIADVRYSAAQIATALGLPTPTPEQQAVIEAPLTSMLVVAGAGSGKTETMSGRVVWLVANGLVDPERILGLTFTRKAAGELAERIGGRLRRLTTTELRSESAGGALEADALPTVATYHSYAGGSSPSTACVSASNPTHVCSPRPPPGSTRTRSSSATTGRWRRSATRSPPSLRRCATSREAWPNTSPRPMTCGDTSLTSRRTSRACRPARAGRACRPRSRSSWNTCGPNAR